jgi:hypothetical protein
MSYKYIFIMILFSFIIACSHVNYIGKSYQETSDVDVYFSESETAIEFEIMGHAISAGQLFVSVDDLKEKLVEEAKQNGADAIIITGIDRDSELDGRGYDAEKQIKATFIKYK